MKGKLTKILSKSIKTFAILSIALVFFTPFMQVAKSATIDVTFDSFTEYDLDGKLVTTSYAITSTQTRADDEGWVYKDYGAGHFNGDFAYSFTYRPTTYSLSGSYNMLFWLCNNLDSWWHNVIDAKNAGIGVYIRAQATYNEVTILSQDGTSSNSTLVAASLPLENDYYFVIWYDDSESLLSLNIYSDSTFNNLLYSGSVGVLESPSYRYMQLCSLMDKDTNTAGGWYGTLGYLKQYTSSTPPIVTTGTASNLYYNSYGDFYYSNISCNVTNDGGSLIDAGIQYRLLGDSEWTTIQTGSYYDDGTGHEYLQALTSESLTLGETYEYRAWGKNDFALSYGDTESFSFNITLTEPQAYMLDWPIYYPSYVGDNVTFFGSSLYDGGENCTGFFWWKEGVSGSWISTDGEATTDIQTGDTFYYELAIDAGTEYFVKCSLSNSYTTVNSTNTISFTWDNATSPVIITQSPEHDTDYDPFFDTVDITFKGNIIDDGNSDCLVAFDYRAVGESSYDTVYLEDTYNTGDNVTYTMTGFIPNTSYEVRFKAANQATYNQYTAQYTYVTGDWSTTTTNAAVQTPEVTTVSATWKDNYTAEVGATITADGGALCSGFIQYKEKNISTGWQTSMYYASELSEGDTYYILVNNLEYGTVYEFRAMAKNGAGTGYGFVIEYTNIAGTDTTTTSNDSGWVANLGSWLATYGMNNTGGHVLFILICMIILFAIPVLIPGVNFQRYIGITSVVGGLLASIVLVVGIVIGWIPAIMTAIVVCVFAGGVAIFAVKRLQGNTQGGLE